MSSGRPPVDYESVAARYDAGRRLSVEATESWRRALIEYLDGSGPGRVLDVGAGTGLFLPLWSQWGAHPVIGVEPSAGMREITLQSGAGPLVAGRAERLPVRDGCVDVVWMSAVLHHIADRPACAAEVARVLGSGGRWLLRGFFHDRSEVGWLRWFPGAERAVAVFPSSTEVVRLAGDFGMDFMGAQEVTSDKDFTLGEAADWVRSMRSADTLLSALTDSEIAVGLTRLEAQADAPCPPNRLSLLAFRAGGSERTEDPMLVQRVTTASPD